MSARSFEELWVALDQLPEGAVGEIVDGHIVVQPRPSDAHVGAQTELGGMLHAPFRRGHGGPGGWVFRVEPRVRLADEVRVPDLAGWRGERFVAPDEGPIVIAPDWICEVLSPGTAATDRAIKMPLYARSGVVHLWLLDPIARVLEVYRRTSEGLWLLLGVHGGATVVRAEPFDAIELDLSLLWPAS